MASETPRIQVVTRRWKYAAPPWRVYEALVNDWEQWLDPRQGEYVPKVAEATPSERVVLAPWVDPEIDDVEVLFANDGRYGAQLTVVVHADHELGADRSREVRYRLGTLFGASLRDWVDG